MFALLAAIFAGVGLVMSLTDAAVPGWLLWAVLVCISIHLLVGLWPFGNIKINRRVQ